MTAARKGPRASARNARVHGTRLWALTAVMAAALGLLVYVSITSLPYLISSPTTDPHFGALNHCLSQEVPSARLGWDVAPDASRAAVYGPQVVAVCDRSGAPVRLPLAGAVAVAFDGDNRLWVAAGSRLLREEGAGLRPMGDFAPVMLAGHAGGVLALDAAGQLVSVAPDGSVLGQALVPGAEGRLSVGPGGTLAAVVADGTAWVYDARSLTPVRAEAPCAVGALWWLDTPERVLLGCGPEGAPAFSVDLRTGTHTEAPRRPPMAARRLPGLPLYVQGCDGLPCTATPP